MDTFSVSTVRCGSDEAGRLRDNAYRNALEALFRYSYEQGLAGSELTIEELFHPTTPELRDIATHDNSCGR
jgi:hypothetical protein